MERMDFNEFCDAVRDGVAEHLLQYEIEEIRLEHVRHNNGVEHVGLVILQKGEKISPTIYLEQFYDWMKQNDMSVEQVLGRIAREYARVYSYMKERGSYSVDPEHIADHVFLRLVNYEKNSQTLEGCPYLPFYDMAVTFRYLVRDDESGIASALLNTDILKKSGLSVEELFRAARANTVQMFPPFVERLDHFLEEHFPQEVAYPSEPEVYILSNDRFIYGATMMLYKEVISEFSEKQGKSVFIVPSSVNEVLLYPTDDSSEREMLANTLHEVNEMIVSDTDFLSDTVYFYDRETGDILSDGR